MHAPQLAVGEGEEFATDGGITIGKRRQHAALNHEDFRIGYRLGRKDVLFVELQSEDVAGQIKPADLAAPVAENLVGAHAAADDLVDIVSWFVFAEDFRIPLVR
jgi:hypothetical protein